MQEIYWLVSVCACIVIMTSDVLSQMFSVGKETGDILSYLGGLLGLIISQKE